MSLATHVVRDGSGRKIGRMNLVWTTSTVGPDFDEFDPTADLSDGDSFGCPGGRCDEECGLDIDSNQEFKDWLCGIDRDEEDDLYDDSLDILIAREERRRRNEDLPAELETWREASSAQSGGTLFQGRGSHGRSDTSCGEGNCRQQKCRRTKRRFVTIRGAYVICVSRGAKSILIAYPRRHH
jgi:hypothetical protein